jgi:Tfp pilus assembly protein PilF
MIRFLLPLLTVSVGLAAEPSYELSVRMVPRLGGYVSLTGVNSPFATTTFVDPSGKFHFKKLQSGLYSLAIFNRRRGEVRRTVDVGPATADPKGRVHLTLELQDSDFTLSTIVRRNLVSAKQLSVPESALRDFRNAQNDLSKHNTTLAVKRLEHAVSLAPQFAAAWNSLGVIAFQTRKFSRAEECFRNALQQDPQSFEARVNLGGVLVTTRQLDQAMEENLKAVLARPNDALANSQLGMTYFLLDQETLAEKYLARTRDIDPSHFSFPQLLLFQIHLRRQDHAAAADDLDDFLSRHPDWPEAGKVRQTITALRASAGEETAK